MRNAKFGHLIDKKILLSALAIVLICAGCEKESTLEKQQEASDLEIKTFITANNIPAEQSSHGLYYQLLIKNESGQKPKVGEVMAVKYEIQTLNGEVLESHMEDSTLMRFGWNYVIPNGFNYGLDIMRKGEKIRIYLPAYAAYDSYNAKSQFGPYTNFIVDIELIEIFTEEEIYEKQIDQIEDYLATVATDQIVPSTSGLYYQTLVAGDGSEAKTYHTASIHYQRRYLDGTVIQETEEDKPLVVKLDRNQLVPGFREGVLKMREGEKALLVMPSEIAFGASIKVIPSTLREELWQNGYIGSLVDAYEAVIYEVELQQVK